MSMRQEQSVYHLTYHTEQAESKIQIPGWLRKNAGWRSQGLLSDEEFAQSIQYLTVTGMIKI